MKRSDPSGPGKPTPIRMSDRLRDAVLAALREGETLSSFARDALTERIAKRRRKVEK